MESAWIALLVFTLILSYARTDKVLFCYYGSWATYRTGNGKCDVKDLDPNVCTHLVYAFVGINEDGTIRVMDQWLEVTNGNFKAFNQLKARNPNLKTLVAIGGYNEGSAKFSTVANNPMLRPKFAANAAEFAAKHGFDGVDLDWEYPAQRDSRNKGGDKQALTSLLKEMRAETRKRNLLLTVAVAATEAQASTSYDIPAISQYLDYINLMAYDFHGSWDSRTGHHSALKPYDSVSRSLNDEAVVNYWLTQGAPASKIVLGMPTYGKTFKLSNPQQHGLGAPTSGDGTPAMYTKQAGLIGYNELCEKRKTESWPEIWDSNAVVPYTYKDNDWISYDNGRSLQEKATFAVSRGLAGAMIWSIETDDFKNVCGEGAYPLLKHIRAGLGSSQSLSNPRRPFNTYQRAWFNTYNNIEIHQPTAFKCTQSGNFKDPTDCNGFYKCVQNMDSYGQYHFKCSQGMNYNHTLGFCGNAASVKC